MNDQSPNEVMHATSFMGGQNADWLDHLYALYAKDPEAVDAAWRQFFESLGDGAQEVEKVAEGPSWARRDWPPEPSDELTHALDGQWPEEKPEGEEKEASPEKIEAKIREKAAERGFSLAEPKVRQAVTDSIRAIMIIRAYRIRGHLMARLDPLGLRDESMRPELDPASYGFTEADMDRPIFIDNVLGLEIATMRQILEILQRTYCGTFALQYMHIGAKEIVIGMPHRGRLSVLANVMGKPYRAIFNEFQGGSFKPEDVDGSGDVKYHLGASSDREFDGNKVHLSLTANPSHLEAVNPVVLGKVRAKQTQREDRERKEVIPLLLHGDAAFAGQGVVAECFGLSGLTGHRTGGTIHIVVNNQIGFTTAPHFSRSSPYPTDIALMVEAPIFHVNGDDPEAVVHAAKVATEFRQKFGKDVVIDMFCYRRFGHNEGDEPMFTNPLMYKKIKSHKTTLQLYTERLVAQGLISEGEVEEMKAAFQAFLNAEFEAGKTYKPTKADWLDGRWKHLKRQDQDYQRGATAISPDVMQQIGEAITTVPEGLHVHKTVQRMLENKKKMFETGEGFDWATGEALAFGSLLLEGLPVRLAGQDSTRGTFSHRHSGKPSSAILPMALRSCSISSSLRASASG